MLAEFPDCNLLHLLCLYKMMFWYHNLVCWGIQSWIFPCMKSNHLSSSTSSAAYPSETPAPKSNGKSNHTLDFSITNQNSTHHVHDLHLLPVWNLSLYMCCLQQMQVETLQHTFSQQMPPCIHHNYPTHSDEDKYSGQQWLNFKLEHTRIRGNSL